MKPSCFLLILFYLPFVSLACGILIPVLSVAPMVQPCFPLCQRGRSDPSIFLPPHPCLSALSPFFLHPACTTRNLLSLPFSSRHCPPAFLATLPVLHHLFQLLCTFSVSSPQFWVCFSGFPHFSCFSHLFLLDFTISSLAALPLVMLLSILPALPTSLLLLLVV